ncbi:MAG: DMSO/TMAO reductase YedYZ molybdopterin-dependent catalytic subunit [Pirellulaceae bacterium]|jgi:DMSO/TMAO reductase YedYZ molybdopterin-dependent catalytic subunit
MNDGKYQEGDAVSPHNAPAGIIVSRDTFRDERVPPGQSRTRKWPVLDAFGPPQIDLDNWKLEVFGMVDKPYSLTLDEFKRLPRISVFADFHCVTRWSRLSNIWEGVSHRELLEPAKVQPAAKFVILHGYDHGWSTNLPLTDFLAEDALLTDTHDGQPISAEHGGPVRSMVPLLYAWKSAKWIRGIELSDTDKPGYWERAGYHNHGDPWTEERFG